MQNKVKFAVVVPTLNAGQAWIDWISAMSAVGIKNSDVYVIDSSSEDGTVRHSQEAGYHIKVIEPGTFNHGGTRRLAAKEVAQYDFAVFLTQDAVLSDPLSITNILKPFEDQRTAAVCGRQLPRAGAESIEVHARLFNYPEQSTVRSIRDRDALGLKTAFISNSFAAYRLSALKTLI